METPRTATRSAFRWDTTEVLVHNRSVNSTAGGAPGNRVFKFCGLDEPASLPMSGPGFESGTTTFPSSGARQFLVPTLPSALDNPGDCWVPIGRRYSWINRSAAPYLVVPALLDTGSPA
jgi:hypothetical protein